MVLRSGLGYTKCDSVDIISLSTLHRQYRREQQHRLELRFIRSYMRIGLPWFLSFRRDHTSPPIATGASVGIWCVSLLSLHAGLRIHPHAYHSVLDSSSSNLDHSRLDADVPRRSTAYAHAMFFQFKPISALCDRVGPSCKGLSATPLILDAARKPHVLHDVCYMDYSTHELRASP